MFLVIKFANGPFLYKSVIAIGLAYQQEVTRLVTLCLAEIDEAEDMCAPVVGGSKAT